MANNTSITAAYENLPKIVKVLLQLFLGSIIGGIYRIIRFVETKNIVTLIAGILNFVGLGFVFWIVDLVTEIFANKITVLAN
jgi:predicted amino acid racemase